jgi:hypothetical protein
MPQKNIMPQSQVDGAIFLMIMLDGTSRRMYLPPLALPFTFGTGELMG